MPSSVVLSLDKLGFDNRRETSLLARSDEGWCSAEFQDREIGLGGPCSVAGSALSQYVIAYRHKSGHRYDDQEAVEDFPLTEFIHRGIPSRYSIQIQCSASNFGPGYRRRRLFCRARRACTGRENGLVWSCSFDTLRYPGKLDDGEKRSLTELSRPRENRHAALPTTNDVVDGRRV